MQSSPLWFGQDTVDALLRLATRFFQLLEIRLLAFSSCESGKPKGSAEACDGEQLIM